jgi:hypothetical protein
LDCLLTVSIIHPVDRIILFSFLVAWASSVRTETAREECNADGRGVSRTGKRTEEWVVPCGHLAILCLEATMLIRQQAGIHRMVWIP